MKSSDSVLVVAPHPDDETLGAGGLLLRARAEGIPIFWLILTNMSVDYGWSADLVAKRKKEIQQVSDAYGFSGVFDLGLRPAALDTYPLSVLVGRIAEVFHEVKPGTVVLPWKGDAHSDHEVAFTAGHACTKAFRFPSIKRVLSMEILSETNFGSSEDFEPTFFIDVSEHIDSKIKIMQLYESELGKHPFPRSVEAIRALALLRGVQANCHSAEAFRIIRWLDVERANEY